MNEYPSNLGSKEIKSTGDVNITQKPRPPQKEHKETELEFMAQVIKAPLPIADYVSFFKKQIDSWLYTYCMEYLHCNTSVYTPLEEVISAKGIKPDLGMRLLEILNILDGGLPITPLLQNGLMTFMKLPCQMCPDDCIEYTHILVSKEGQMLVNDVLDLKIDHRIFSRFGFDLFK